MKFSLIVDRKIYTPEGYKLSVLRIKILI